MSMYDSKGKLVTGLSTLKPVALPIQVGLIVQSYVSCTLWSQWCYLFIFSLW